MNKLKIFVVHGRDRNALDAVQGWLERRDVSVEQIAFERLSTLGETIPSELERIAALGDAAIVLATPDDIGRLATETETQYRARQNVWLELGWFWARLGRRRTLLVIKGNLDIPSDLSGVLYLKYENDLREISRGLERFVEALHSAGPDSLTELVSVSTDAHSRSWEYHSVFEAAHELVVITGIGMVNLRQDLHAIFHQMRTAKPALKLDMVLLDSEMLKSNEQIAAAAYRPNLMSDILGFERELNDLMKVNPEVRDRISLVRYNGIMSFVATVADPPGWGSLMLVETVLPTGDSHFVARPRMLLRRRCADGLYDRYWSAIGKMKQIGTAVSGLGSDGFSG